MRAKLNGVRLKLASHNDEQRMVGTATHSTRTRRDFNTYVATSAAIIWLAKPAHSSIAGVCAHRSRP